MLDMVLLLFLVELVILDLVLPFRLKEDTKEDSKEDIKEEVGSVEVIKVEEVIKEEEVVVDSNNNNKQLLLDKVDIYSFKEFVISLPFCFCADEK